MCLHEKKITMHLFIHEYAIWEIDKAIKYVSVLLKTVEKQPPTIIFKWREYIPLLVDYPVYCLYSIYASQNILNLV